MVGIKLTRGNTGRTTPWNTDDLRDVGNHIHQLTGLIDSLVGSGRFESPAKATEHLTLAAEGLARLVTEIHSITPTDLEGVFFRARPADSPTPPTDFGVPPNQRPNRFNGVGETALYVARTEDVLRSEISQTNGSAELWAQRFELKSADLKLLKLDPGSCVAYPALNQFVIMSERHVAPEHSHAHIGTQLLRVLCVGIGIDAIEYPTVTGAFSSDVSATNVAAVTKKAISAFAAAGVGAPYRLS